jgi:riboflavin transporter 2
MFLGESLTSTLPTLIALAQGVGGEVECIRNNETLSIEPVYSKPRFSVSVFFILISGIIGISLIAFIILRTTSVVELANAEDKISQENSIETCEMLLKTNSKIEKVSLSTPNSMTKKQFYILQLFNVLNSAILFGCLPTLITYSVLPYGQKAFYYCSVLSPISYPLSALYGILRPTLSIFWITIGSIFGYFICLFIIIVAFQSPCPIWADTLHGGIIMITAWFISSFVLGYIRVASGNRIKLAWKNDNGLFYFGLSVQLGLIFGVVPMYLVINVYQILKDRHPCITYCL